MYPWLASIGHTRGWLMHSVDRLPEPLQCLTAFACAAVMAAAISCVTQLSGPQTALRGMRGATALWLGFVITTWAPEYVFEVRPWSLLGINAGFWFLGMNLMGAIVGGWKAKAAKAVGQESRASARPDRDR